MSEERDYRFLLERTVFKIVLFGAAFLVVAAAYIIYFSMTLVPESQTEKMTGDNAAEDGAGSVKALPDFIIDKVKPDELEQLKP